MSQTEQDGSNKRIYLIIWYLWCTVTLESFLRLFHHFRAKFEDLVWCLKSKISAIETINDNVTIRLTRSDVRRIYCQCCITHEHDVWKSVGMQSTNDNNFLILFNNRLNQQVECSWFVLICGGQICPDFAKMCPFFRF